MIDHIAGGRVQGVMRRAVEGAMSVAKDAGAKTSPINTKPFRRAFDIWASAMSEVQEQSYAQILGGGDRPVSLLAEIGRWAIRRPRITPAAMMMIVAESLTKFIPAHRMRAAVQAGRDLQAQLEKTLGPNGVLICPPYTQPAPRHDSTLFNPFDFACTGIFNVLEFPGTVVPFGFDPPRPSPLRPNCRGQRPRPHHVGRRRRHRALHRRLVVRQSPPHLPRRLTRRPPHPPPFGAAALSPSGGEFWTCSDCIRARPGRGRGCGVEGVVGRSGVECRPFVCSEVDKHSQSASGSPNRTPHTLHPTPLSQACRVKENQRATLHAVGERGWG